MKRPTRKSSPPKKLVIIAGMIIVLFSVYQSVGAQTAGCNNKEADQFIEQGDAQYNKKNNQQALEFYEQAVKSAPECAVAQFKKGDTLYYLARYAEAVSALEQSIKLNYAESWRPLALICSNYFELKKDKETVSSCNEAAKANNKYEPTYAYLADVYFRTSDHQAALKTVNSAIELNPEQFDTHFLKARILYLLGNKTESIAEFIAAYKLRPDNPEAVAELGTVYFETQNYQKTVEVLSQAVKLNPGNWQSWLLLGSSYGYLNKWSQAETALKEAVRLQPENGNIYYALGSAQLFTGNLQETAKSFDAAIKYKNLLQVSAAVYKGYAYISLYEKDKADEAFQEALTLKPVAAIDYQILSWIHSYRWEMDKAREQLEKSIAFDANDDDATSYALLSWNRILANDPQAAIIAANEAIRQNSKGTIGYTQRCRAYNELNLPDIAIRDCQKALETDANDGEAMFYLGNSYSLKKLNNEAGLYNQKAIKSLEKTLGISPEPVTMGGKVISADMPAAGRSSGKKFNISSPLFIEFLYLLGNAYVRDGNYPSAVKIYENCVNLRPKFPRLRFNLAVSYLHLKSPDVKNAGLQYEALMPLDADLAATLKKSLNAVKANR